MLLKTSGKGGRKNVRDRDGDAEAVKKEGCTLNCNGLERVKE